MDFEARDKLHHHLGALLSVAFTWVLLIVPCTGGSVNANTRFAKVGISWIFAQTFGEIDKIRLQYRQHCTLAVSVV